MKWAKASKCKLPHNSEIYHRLDCCDFNDSYAIEINDLSLTPLDVYLKIMKEVPVWINALLLIRNKIVSIFGLKNVGLLGDFEQSSLQTKNDLVGTKLDIFTIKSMLQDEMVLIESDKHLDIYISIVIKKESNKASVVLSTLVENHNILGNIYMFIIKPVHKIIVKRLLMSLNHLNKKDLP